MIGVNVLLLKGTGNWFSYEVKFSNGKSFPERVDNIREQGQFKTPSGKASEAVAFMEGVVNTEFYTAKKYTVIMKP